MGPRFSHDTHLLNVNDDEDDEQEVQGIREQKPRHNSKKKKITVGENLPSKETEILQIKQNHNNNSEDKDLIEKCILKNFFMCSLKQQARLAIIKEMSLAYVPKDTILFEQGAVGNFFYIIKQGTCELVINGKKIKTLSVGESFGELALLHGAPRSGTVTAITECYLWVMERKNFKKIVKYIAKINYEENKSFIQSVPVLANIDHYLQAILCASLIKASFEAGSYIVKEGELATCIYIIKEGEVNCLKGGKLIRTLKRGDNFGEKSILVESSRTLDVVAKTNCICYSVSVETLQNMLGDNFRTFLYLNFLKKSFSTSKFFQRFNSFLIDQIFELFEGVNLGEGSIAFPAGYVKSSCVVVIIDGHLINSKTKEVVANRGGILFEEELVNNSEDKIDYDLVPFSDCLLIKADTKEVIKALGANFKETMEKGEIINSLSKVHVFKNLPRKKLNILAQKIGIQNFKNGEEIIKEGETGNKFYIVKSGKVDIYVQGKYIRTLNEGENFGERALFFNEKRSATIKAVKDVEVFYISQDDFMNNIESNMKEHLMNRLYLQDNTIELKDLEFTKQLGSGNYGNVSLVTCKKNKFLYAIKGISRKQINNEQLHKNLELERSILLSIDHPFIVKLVKSLKDEKYIYFLMEYIKGKELFEVIREIGLLSKSQTQFYGGSLLLAIEYLHERKIIYRDLKPENVMVLYKTGYIKLIDFGTAKKIEDRTTTIIGTPHYMAPEVILGEGYSFQVDYWSIAICMYEFICGGVPFGESAEDPMEVYMAIVNCKLDFPSFCKNKNFKRLMTRMLCKSPANRLTKINQIKNDFWFQKFSWEDLMSMNLPPAWLPQVKKEENEKENRVGEGMPFSDYVKKYYKDWLDSSENLLPPEKKAEYDKWYENF